MSEFDIASEFGLENGESKLSNWFHEVLKERYEKFEEFVKAEMLKKGSIFISKSSGIFESRKLKG